MKLKIEIIDDNSFRILEQEDETYKSNPIYIDNEMAVYQRFYPEFNSFGIDEGCKEKGRMLLYLRGINYDSRLKKIDCKGQLLLVIQKLAHIFSDFEVTGKDRIKIGELKCTR